MAKLPLIWTHVLETRAKERRIGKIIGEREEEIKESKRKKRRENKKKGMGGKEKEHSGGNRNGLRSPRLPLDE